MKNFLKVRRGTYTVSGPSGSNTYSTDSGFEQLNSHPILKGDFHTPLVWSYNKDDITYVNGSQRRIEADGSTTTISGVLAANAGMTTEYELITQHQNSLDNCLRSLYEALRGNTDLTCTAAEMYKDNILHSARQYVDFVRNWKKRIRNMTKRDASKLWLRVNYEIVPLASDLYSIVKAATGTSLRKGFGVECRGYSKCGLPPQTVVAFGISYAPRKPEGEIESWSTGTFRFIVNPALDQAAQLASMDPLKIAWNLLPWTFVIDWFYNVGNYMNALETQALYSSSCKGGFVSSRTRCKFRHSFTATSRTGNTVLQSDIKSAVVQQRFYRQVYSGLPAVPYPRLNLNLGGKQLLNLAALIHVNWS